MKSPNFSDEFNAHLNGGHFANGVAGYHIYRPEALPAGVTGLTKGVIYDEGAYVGTITRRRGGQVRSTFFPDPWDIDKVRREITDNWASIRPVGGVVHVIRRGPKKLAIAVNITDGKTVSAFPARRSHTGGWITKPP